MGGGVACCEPAPLRPRASIESALIAHCNLLSLPLRLRVALRRSLRSHIALSHTRVSRRRSVGCTVARYWQPRDGNYSSRRARFPVDEPNERRTTRTMRPVRVRCRLTIWRRRNKRTIHASLCDRSPRSDDHRETITPSPPLSHPKYFAP